MWSDEEESHFGRKREPIVETWEEYAQVYRSYERFMTISEHDRKETVRVFFIEQDVPPSEDGVLDFVPTNMLSAVFLHTHKGKHIETGTKVQPVLLVYCRTTCLSMMSCGATLTNEETIAKQ